MNMIRWVQMFFIAIFILGIAPSLPAQQGYDPNSIITDSSQQNENGVILQNAQTTNYDKRDTNRAYQDSSKAEEELSLENMGMIMDETKSIAGRELYDIFYSNWSAPANAKGFTVTLHEEPVRGRLTRLVIEVNNSTIFETFLRPQTSELEQIAMEAIRRVQDYLSNYEEIQKELGGEDMEGTGIY